MGYEAELDTSTLCDPEEASCFQSIFGVMRWMIEIGRVDITIEVSLILSFLAIPRVGHLKVVINIIGYLRLHHNSRLFLDLTYPVLDHSSFNDGAAWAEFCGDATKAIPLNMHAPRGKDIDIRLMCDRDHAGDKSTRQYRTGYLIFINMALIAWLSKKQLTVESSVFGA